MKPGITSKNCTAVPAQRRTNRNKLRCSVVENRSRELTILWYARLTAGSAISILISSCTPHSHDGMTKEHSQDVSDISTRRLQKPCRTTLSAINHFWPKCTHDSVSLFELILYGKVNGHEHTYCIRQETDFL